MHLGFGLLTLLPGRMGGSETNVRGLLGAFRAGHGPERVTVLANRQVEQAYDSLVGGAVRLHRVRSYRTGDADLSRLLAMTAARALPRLVARDVPRDLDVVHFPVTVPIPRVGAPSVVTVFDVQHHELPHFFSAAERRYRAWAYDAAARGATRVVTSSEHSRNGLIEHAGVRPDRIDVIPLGVDHERFRPAAEDVPELDALGLPARFVMYPANLWPHKNHERLLEALAAVPDRSLHLVLTGQTYGRLDALLGRAAALGLGDRVRHLGYLPAQALPEAYRRAAALVFPSLFEGFGSPPLEAMACGCPVAASGAGSLGEVCGDTALLFDPASVDDIAAAIARITGDDELRSRLRDDGLQRAARYTWESAAAAHRATYERAARQDR